MKAKNIIIELKRAFSVSFSAPTSEIADGKTALNYLDSKAAYVVIPGIENSSVYNAEQIILQILPHTNKQIVDITLPYIEINKKKQAIRHLARYILGDKKILGIKIKLSEHWPRLKSQRIPISDAVRNYYQKQGIKNYSETILVGQFCIFTKSFKIAPLFQSQISSLSQNAIKTVLTEYYGFGCQIFSVVNDLSNEKKKNLKNSIQIFKNHRKQSTIAIYSGVNYSPDLNQFYKTNAFASQGNVYFKEIKIINLDKIYKQTFIIDLNQLQRRKKVKQSNDSNYGKSQIQALQCYDFRLRQSFLTLNDNLTSQTNKTDMSMDQQIRQIINNQNSLLIYLWYLYENVNRKNAFVLPWPMEEKDELLFKQIKKLSQLLNNIPKQQLITIIKLDSKLKNTNSIGLDSFKIIPIQKIDLQDKQLYVYFDITNKFQYRNLQNDKNTKLNFNQIQNKIINCNKCVRNDQFIKRIYQKNQKNKNQTQQITSQDQKFVQKFLKRKSNLSIQQFYFEIVKYYPRTKITSDFLKILFNILKNKIKKQFTGSLFQNYILSQNFEGILDIFHQTQRHYFSSSTSVKNQQDEINNEQQQNDQNKKDNNFRKLILQVKNHCNRQKRQYNLCHLCKCMFNKTQRANYGRKCLGCNHFMCFGCYDKQTGQNAKTQQAFMSCLVCQKICQCEQCIKRLHKIANINNNNNLKILTDEKIRKNNYSQIIKKNQNDYKSINIKNQHINIQQQQNVLQNSLSNLPVSQKIMEQIKRCSVCQIYNRNTVNIDFQCSICKILVCFTCQKSQNYNRNWVLRGPIKCNTCYLKQNQQNQQKIQLMKSKSKVTDLQYQNSQLKRQLLFKNISNQNNYDFNYDNQYNNNSDIGGATPIFDRELNITFDNNNLQSSPYRQHQNQNQSQASFGGKNKNIELNNKNKRKNSSNSSRSNSPPTTLPNFLQIKQNKKEEIRQKKRKNSSMSSGSNSPPLKKQNYKQHKIIQERKRSKSNSSKSDKSFGQKKSNVQNNKNNNINNNRNNQFDRYSNSSLSSRQSKRSQSFNLINNTDNNNNNNNNNNNDNSLIKQKIRANSSQSGQYSGSQSSEKTKKQRNWRNNIHKNNNNSYNNNNNQQRNQFSNFRGNNNFNRSNDNFKSKPRGGGSGYRDDNNRNYNKDNNNIERGNRNNRAGNDRQLGNNNNNYRNNNDRRDNNNKRNDYNNNNNNNNNNNKNNWYNSSNRQFNNRYDSSFESNNRNNEQNQGEKYNNNSIKQNQNSGLLFHTPMPSNGQEMDY